VTRILSKTDLRRLLKPRDVLNAVEQAFVSMEQGRAVVPPRVGIHVPEHSGVCLVMPGYLSDSGALGVKTVTVYPGNPDRYGLPNVLGTVALLDCRTGHPTCIMDAGYLTAIRTGAVCAVATKYLARAEAHSVGVIGTGAQAGAIVEAVCEVRVIGEIKVYSLEPENRRKRFADGVRASTGVQVTMTSCAEEAVRDSDVVVLATSSKSPVLSGTWLRPGAHVNAIGNHDPESREVDSETVRRSIVVCDDIDACLKEAGDVMIPLKSGEIPAQHVSLNLGQVVLGRGPSRSADDITLFKSVGLAIQDMSTALLAYTRAVELNVGIDVELT